MFVSAGVLFSDCYFGLKNISDLPGIDDLKSSGLLEKDNIIFKDDPAK